MGLFGLTRVSKPTDLLGPLRDRVSSLEVDLDKLQRRFKDIELEWETAYDKVHKATQRLNKRVRDAERREVDAEEPNGEPEVDQFTQRVLARRRNA